MIESLLVAHLKDQTSAGDRIDPIRLKHGSALPAITYQVIDAPHDYSHDGLTFIRPRIQFNCWGATYKASKQLYVEVRDRLIGRHVLGGHTVTIKVEDQLDDIEETTDLYIQRLDAIVKHGKEVSA